MALTGAPPMYINTPLALLHTPAYMTGNHDSFTLEASHMALSHNSFIRGFNSIYQQAPRITVSDSKDFIGYCLAWHACVDEHHHYEETKLFPAIEAAVGEEGILDGEVEEHAAFHKGLEAFKTYLVNLADHESDFSSAKLIAIMNSFSEPLYSHLRSEPEVLLALSRFSTPERPIDLVEIGSTAGKQSLTPGFIFNVLPVFLLNMETVEFEGGMWHDVFPPIRGMMKWILTRGVPLWQRRQWRFSSCDADGRVKRLAV
ncbi:MAG: hypothetical protein M1816_001613 [Peltula sp. TS41687]|nr:MAG: hypothetical protein M1816_001613 [Peltula sp. TS41687]